MRVRSEPRQFQLDRNGKVMFSRFLDEGAATCGEPGLADSADEFRGVSERWEELGTWSRRTSGTAERIPLLAEGSAALDRLADLEEAAWQRLAALP